MLPKVPPVGCETPIVVVLGPVVPVVVAVVPVTGVVTCRTSAQELSGNSVLVRRMPRSVDRLFRTLARPRQVHGCSTPGYHMH